MATKTINALKLAHGMLVHVQKGGTYSFKDWHDNMRLIVEALPKQAEPAFTIDKFEKRVRVWDRNNFRNRAEFESKPRVYISHAKESVVDNMIARRSRPVAFYQTLLPMLLEKCGLPRDTKMQWSQKAGCGCGCSPGFIINTRAERFDVWVTVSGGPTANDDPQTKELLAARSVAVGVAANHA